MFINDLSYYNHEMVLMESNIVNGGKTSIVLLDANGVEFDVIHSTESIIANFLNRDVFKNERMQPQVKQWYKSNFKNWLKRAAPGYTTEFGIGETRFRQILYEPLDYFIQRIIDEENDPKRVNRAVVLRSLPSYIQDNPKDSFVFSGGRKFRLRRFVPILENLSDYLIAVQTNIDANMQRGNIIVPRRYMVKNIQALTPIQALHAQEEWHNYTAEHAEQVSKEQLAAGVASLKPGQDFKVIAQLEGGYVAIQMQTARCAEIESAALLHCVHSYGTDIEKGRSTILSIRDSDGYPGATLELSNKGKTVKQIKGRKNSNVQKRFVKPTIEFLLKSGLDVKTPDLRNLGLTSQEFNEIKQQKLTTQQNESFIEYLVRSN